MNFLEELLHNIPLWPVPWGKRLATGEEVFYLGPWDLADTHIIRVCSAPHPEVSGRQYAELVYSMRMLSDLGVAAVEDMILREARAVHRQVRERGEA